MGKETTHQSHLAILKKSIDEYRDHFVITDDNSRALYMNPAAEEHTGFSAEETIGKKPSELWGGHMPKSYYEEMWQTLSEKKLPFVGQVENKRKDGTPYMQELHISPILNSNNKVEFFIGIEPKIHNVKKFELFMSKLSNSIDEDAEFSSPIYALGWITTWLNVYTVIGEQAQEEIVQAYPKQASGADLIRDFLKFIEA